MLGYSVAYFFSQYWRNVPLYAEKIIPLLDTFLSNNYIYKDKLSEAFYELINKYQNTSELPLENLKEFIRENGYGYILDLMQQDEESIKMLWYLLVLIHQLKGSKQGLEIVLNMFSGSSDYDTDNVLETLGEPTRTETGSFYNQQGSTLLTNPLNVTGACPMGSEGSFTYTLPSTGYIGAGTYYLKWTNTSFESIGKLNSIKFTATLANTDEVVLYENNNLIFTYPSKDYQIMFTREVSDSPIKSLKVEYTCDYYNKKGACINGIKILQGGTNVLTGGSIDTSSSFFGNYGVEKAFVDYSVLNTAPTSDGTITLLYENSLDAGEYTMNWSLLGLDTNKKLENLSIEIRYNDWVAKGDEALVNTLGIFNEESIPYIFNKKDYSVSFRALKPFNQIYISYEVSSNTSTEVKPRFYMSNLAIVKRSSTTTVRTIPNMTSLSTPNGSVTTTGKFTDSHESYRAFNYTNPLGSVPTADGYIKYDYEYENRPTTGDYVFTWCNGSTDNNNYVTSMNAYVTYIDDSQQLISSQADLLPLEAKTKYYFKFYASKTIKSLTIYYTCNYNEGIGGNISEVNITYTKDTAKGSNISVWHEPLPVGTENTFSVEADVDIAKTGSEFFYNFKNFVSHYVYPELQSLKVKYSLEGAQTQRIYNVIKIDYESDLKTDKTLTIVTIPEDATVVLTCGSVTVTGKVIEVEQGDTVNYNISRQYYYPTSGSQVVLDDMTLTKTLTEYPKYTVTYNPVDSTTQVTVGNVRYTLSSAEGISHINSVTVHDGTSISYILDSPDYELVSGTTTPTASTTLTIPLTKCLTIAEVEAMTIDTLNQTNISRFGR